jgi:phage terminase large subunit-like protein
VELAVDGATRAAAADRTGRAGRRLVGGAVQRRTWRGEDPAGGEYVREIDRRWHSLGRDPGQDLRVALLGRTAGDVRDTILNGESGLLNIYPPSEQDKVEWISSQRRVNLPHGGFCLCFSAEEPDQLRGPAFHLGWADELAAYKQIRGQGELDAWTNLRIATRLGLAAAGHRHDHPEAGEDPPRADRRDPGQPGR